MTLIEANAASPAVPIVPVMASGLPGLADSLGTASKRWFESVCFTGAAGSVCMIPAKDGGLERVVVGVPDRPDVFALAHLPMLLPPGDYRLALEGAAPIDPTLAALGFVLGSYQFTRYRAAKRAPARLVRPEGIDTAWITRMAYAISLVRDLVNTPSEQMGPGDLEDQVHLLAKKYAGTSRAYTGKELLAANFPAIYAVGRASHRAPRLIELEWGDPAHPRVAIVGKGVCFDTGGLDLKTADGMRWMKKDMGGAAHAIALASLVMDAALPVRLHLLIPAVENAIGPDAYRPGEVIKTRTGITVEIDNTDAEGRVVMGDALAYAAEHAPNLLLDFATLTGAARVALGPELPAMFSNRDELARGFVDLSHALQDPVWHMPLWKPYASMLDSTIADMTNSGASRMAGSITAALYLDRFVPPAIPWCHFDTYSWNDIERPGRPRGGEAQGLRAAFEFVRQRYTR